MPIKPVASYISIKNIIARVYSNLNLKEEERFYDMFEWGAEAMEFIGAAKHLEDRAWEACIEDYKSLLPCDIVEIQQVSYCGYPLQPKSSTYGIPHTPWTAEVQDHGILADRIIDGNQLAGEPIQYNGIHSYEIIGGYIKTSFRTGELIVYYKGMPVDEEGFPLIPDEINCREAIFWYIFRMLLLGGFSHPTINFEYAQVMWEKYCRQARSYANMPTLDQLENIKRRFLNLKPNLRAANNFFRDLNSERPTL